LMTHKLPSYRRVERSEGEEKTREGRSKTIEHSARKRGDINIEETEGNGYQLGGNW